MREEKRDTPPTNATARLESGCCLSIAGLLPVSLMVTSVYKDEDS
jgi:hypothetical protein